MTTYEQFSEQSMPEDAVVVRIHKEGAFFLGDVHRRLAVIEGSVSAEDNEGPMLVPAALTMADSILVALTPHGFSRVGVVLSSATKWDPTWGQLGDLQ